MGVLTWKGATAKESLGSETVALVPEWADGSRASPTTRSAEAGAVLFAQSGCLNCHVYLGAGGQNLGAPDLTDEGAKGRGVAVAGRPPQVPELRQTPARRCPSFGDLGDDNLRKIAIFLEASKGEQK